MKKKYINNYLNLFSNLNKENIKKFDDLVVKDIIFIDPFNNIKGLDNFKNIFYHMFDTVEEPKFDIVDYAQNKDHIFLKWKMTFYAFKASQTIEGMSDITLNQEGKVISHLDYWDSLNGIFIKLPFLGFLYKISLRMFKIKN
ncbi:nuclear transport factor 2 family protein [Alphaproteobacteria bacterium]|nr:nuclear transport factor 2 family protein [Alphaproteobacteria bacterium]